MTSLEKLLTVAKGEVGETESPAGSNRTKYGAAYGWDGVPWCVIFLWWCFREAGLEELFCGGAKTASCSHLLAWYRGGGMTAAAEAVRPGDIVLLNFSGGREPRHCGLAAAAVPGTDHFLTIEGNTSTRGEGSQDNGGCVAMKTRYRSQVVGVCRPPYREEAVPPVPGDDAAGHWAEEHIRWAMDKGLMTGYGDGTWQPDRPVTRAELAAVLHRLKGAGA